MMNSNRVFWYFHFLYRFNAKNVPFHSSPRVVVNIIRRRKHFTSILCTISSFRHVYLSQNSIPTFMYTRSKSSRSFIYSELSENINRSRICSSACIATVLPEHPSKESKALSFLICFHVNVLLTFKVD